jgi:hypothetical protein
MGTRFTVSTFLIQTSTNLRVSEHPSADADCRIMLCRNTLTDSGGCMRSAQIRQKLGVRIPSGALNRRAQRTGALSESQVIPPL